MARAPAGAPARNLPAALPAEWRQAFAWIERELGGRVVAAERQPRWRPAWFLDLERGGETLPLYFRGERGETDHGVYGLEHEMRVLQVLEAHEIPVPHVFGFCPAPRGIVMERCPGRANLATAESEAEREAVLDEYVDVLARIHRIDVAAFEAAGLRRPATPEALALLDFDAWERAYRRRKRRPEPAVEFAIRWVRREAPRDRRRASLVCCDAGQFLFERGRLTAVIDLELACLGDPLADLGGMRGRDLSEPLGDLSRAVRRYEAATGEPVDRGALDFHTVRFGIVTPMAVAHLTADPPPEIDVVQYLAWYLVWTRSALEVIGARLGLELEPPRARPGTQTPVASDFDAYRSDAATRLAVYRERLAKLGPDLEAEDVAEAAALLGRRPPDAAAAAAALEALVASAGPERDAELLACLHRRILRHESILAPVMRELEGAHIQRIH
jgi:aminoglycoside phosphotransferase (APT) family kinase protein